MPGDTVFDPWNVMDDSQKQAILARIAGERAAQATSTPPAMPAV